MFDMPTVILLVIYYFTWQVRVTVINFKDAAGIWNADFWKPYVAASVNLVVNIILVKLIGINGVFISTIICMLFINMPWETHVLFENLFHRSPAQFYQNQAKVAGRTLVACCVTFFVCSLITVEGILGFVLKCTICVIIPNMVLLAFVYKTEEFKYWINKVLAVRKMIF